MAKMYSSKQDQSYGNTKYALLKEYDPTQHYVKVGYYNPTTDDHDLISGWLPIISPYLGLGDDTDAGSGNSWGIICAPNINQPVLVISQHGNFQNGMVIGGTFSDKAAPVPKVDDAYTQDGEYLLLHKYGSYLKFFNDKDINLYSTNDLNLHSDKDTNMGIKGQLVANVTGAISMVSGGTITEAAKNQIVLDAPVVTVTNTLVVGNGATGSFESNGIVITVENGIVTNIN